MSTLKAFSYVMQGFEPGDEHDNGNGTISVQKANGKWLCCTPEGYLEGRDSPGGVWESFLPGNGCLVAERELEHKDAAGNVISTTRVVYVIGAAWTQK